MKRPAPPRPSKAARGQGPNSSGTDSSALDPSASDSSASGADRLSPRPPPPVRAASGSDTNEMDLPDQPSPPRASDIAAPNFSLPPPEPNRVVALPDVSSQALPLAEMCRIELPSKKQDPLRQARIHHELGTLATDPGEALRHHLRALELHPQFRPSLVKARRLLLDARNLAAGLPLFDAELRLVETAREQAELHFQKGRALEDLQQDLPAARACYRRAVALSPASPRYLKALHQTDVCLGDWSAAVATREQEQGAAKGDLAYRAALLVDQAVQLETRLDNPSLATELYQRALTIDPDVSGALPSLKRLHHRQARWHDLITVLEHESARTVDDRVRSSALMQMGQVQALRLGDRHAAIEALGRAMEVNRTDRLVLGRLAGLYDDAGEAQHLAHVLAHEVETVVEVDDKISIILRIANIYERLLQNTEEACRWYEAGLRLRPSDRPTLAALGALYRRTESWQSLVVMNLAAAEAESDKNLCARYHFEIAGLFEQQLVEPEQAMRHYNLALGLDPKHDGAFKSLVRLYADHGRYRELIEVHQRAIDLSEETYLREAHFFRIAEVYEFNLVQPDRAIPMYRAILDAVPGHLGALHALQRAAESAGSFDDLVGALEEEARTIRQKERIIGIYMRAGQVLSEQLGQHEQALLRYDAVRKLDPDYTPALSALAGTYARLGRHRDELEIREEWLRLCDDTRQQAQLLQGMAEVCEQRLGDGDAALVHYRRAVEADPSFDEPFRALCRMMEERADYPGVVAALRQRLRAAPDPEARARIHYRMGEVYEVHTGQLRLAESCYVAALSESHDLRCVADSLARVRHGLSAWQERVSDLLHDAGVLGDFRMAIDSLLRAGEIHRGKLGQLEDAIDCFRSVLDKEPHNLAALLALEDAYRQTGAWASLAVVYETLAQVLEQDAARAAVLNELARIQADVLRANSGDVRHTLYRVLQIDEANGYALLMLERLALASRDHALLSDVDSRLATQATDPTLAAAHYVRLGRGLVSSNLQQAHDAFRLAMVHEPANIAALTELRATAERLGDFEALSQALEGEANWTQDNRRAAALLVASAEVHARVANRWQQAVDCAKGALLRDPDCRAGAEMLLGLLRPHGRADELIDVLSAAANAARSTQCVATLWEYVAVLYAEDKQQVVAAIARLEPLEQGGIETVSSAHLLGRLYEERERWLDASQAYTRAFQLGPDEATLVPLELARGRLYIQRLEQPEQAIGCFERVLSVEAMHSEALDFLLQLRQSREELPEAFAIAQRLVAIRHEPAARSEILVTFAKLQLALNQRAGAAASLREAVGLSGALDVAAQEYKQLLGSEEPWGRYAEALRRHLANVEVGRAKGQAKDSYLELAHVEHEKLADSAASLHTLRRGLSACHGDLDIHRVLAERLQVTSQYEAAFAEWQRMLPRLATETQLWRGMSLALEGCGRSIEAAVPCAALVVLGQADEREQSVARQQRLRPGTARADGFSDEVLRQLSVFADRDAEQQMIHVLRAASPAIEKLWPLDFQAYGLSPRDKIPARSDNAMMRRAQALAEAFSLGEFSLYVFASKRLEVVVESHDGLAFMVPESLLAVSPNQQVYALARAFAAAKHGSAFGFTLGQERAQSLFLAAMRYAQPEAGRDSIPGDELDALHRRLHKALGWRARGKVENAARACNVLRGASFGAWLQASVVLRRRAAALITNDLPEVIALEERENDEENGSARQRNAGLSPACCQLLAFWGSPLAFDLRTGTGIL